MNFNHQNPRAYLFTADELEHVEACYARLRKLDIDAPIAALPSAPVDAKGGPDHTRAKLMQFVTDLETATAQHETVASVPKRIDGVQRYVSMAVRADPVGAGSVLPFEVYSMKRDLPKRDAVDEQGKPLYADVASWVAALDAYVEARCAVIMTKVRNFGDYHPDQTV